jgi:hypothetical protein
MSCKGHASLAAECVDARVNAVLAEIVVPVSSFPELDALAACR